MENVIFPVFNTSQEGLPQYAPPYPSLQQGPYFQSSPAGGSMYLVPAAVDQAFFLASQAMAAYNVPAAAQAEGGR